MSKLACTTNDPAPPFNHKEETKYADVGYLQSILLGDHDHDLFDRYRAMFTLREINTTEAVLAACQCLTPENSKKCSALLKHEIAFILAQFKEEA